MTNRSFGWSLVGTLYSLLGFPTVSAAQDQLFTLSHQRGEGSGGYSRYFSLDGMLVRVGYSLTIMVMVEYWRFQRGGRAPVQVEDMEGSFLLGHILRSGKYLKYLQGDWCAESIPSWGFSSDSLAEKLFNELFIWIQRAPFEPKKYLQINACELHRTVKYIYQNQNDIHLEDKFLEKVLLCFLTLHKINWSVTTWEN